MKKFYLVLISFFMLTSVIAKEQPGEGSAPPYSKARIVNETLYIAGQIARDETGELVSGDIKESTRQCMKNIGTILKDYKMDYKDLVMVQIFLMDLDDYDFVNEAYRDFFTDEIFPARLCLQVAKIPGGSPIEISAIAETKRKNGLYLP